MVNRAAAAAASSSRCSAARSASSPTSGATTSRIRRPRTRSSRGGCSAANRTYEANRTRQHAYGRWNGYVDAEPSRQHLQRLALAGMGPKRVAAVSGIAHGVLSGILYGKYLEDGTRRAPNKRVRPATEQRI